MLDLLDIKGVCDSVNDQSSTSTGQMSLTSYMICSVDTGEMIEDWWPSVDGDAAAASDPRIGVHLRPFAETNG